ncbi:MAG: DUF4112 domain-containing protein [Phycisphaerales bacterium]
MAKLARFERLLDHGIRIPGTKIGFGLDSAIGLIPGIGDAAGLVIGFLVIRQAKKLGAPKSLRHRMLGTLIADLLIGLVPGVGDVADVFFQANARNVGLLRRHLESATEKV